MADYLRENTLNPNYQIEHHCQIGQMRSQARLANRAGQWGAMEIDRPIENIRAIEPIGQIDVEAARLPDGLLDVASPHSLAPEYNLQAWL